MFQCGGLFRTAHTIGKLFACNKVCVVACFGEARHREILDDEGRSASLRGETESQGVRLSSAQKRILGYISAETTLSDGVRCSKKELAKQAGCSVQTVDRAIFRLRKLGLVEVEECHAESGAQTANLYRAKR